MTKDNARNSNFELLRILCMVMIVAHHYSVHGGWEFNKEIFSINRYFVQLLSLGGKLGVNCFVLLSGYFMVGKTGFKYRRLIKQGAQILFYVVVLEACAMIFSGKGFDAILLAKKTIYSIYKMKQWWFVWPYFALMLFAPFINSMLAGIDKKTHLKMLALMLLIWSIVPFFTGFSLVYNNFVWFVMLYILAGYIRRCPACEDGVCLRRANRYLIISGLLYLALALYVLCFDLLGTRWAFFAKNCTRLSQQQSPLTVALAVSLLLAFRNMKPRFNKTVNLLASATFGVYLIHEYSSVRTFLWKNFFKNASHLQDSFGELVIHAFVAIAAVYIVCTIIDLARIYIVERPLMRGVDKACDRITASPFYKK